MRCVLLLLALTACDDTGSERPVDAGPDGADAATAEADGGDLDI